MSAPFWPRKSPNFLACRLAVRDLPSPIAVGLSGGCDSLALVAALRAEDKQVHALCVDHQLLPDSLAVVQRAAEQARGFGAHAQVLSVEVQGPHGLEANARAARYEALVAAAAPYGALAVGHTLDDQAETLLLSALRGKASGMPRQRQRAGITLWRPLLKVSRAQTMAACEELGVTPWQDPHNSAQTSRRVALREQVLPLLSQIIGGDAVKALGSAAEELARDEQALEQLAGDVDKLKEAPSAIRRRAIANMLLDAGADVRKAHLDAAEALLDHWHGQGAVNVGNRLVMQRKDGTLWLETAER